MSHSEVFERESVLRDGGYFVYVPEERLPWHVSRLALHILSKIAGYAVRFGAEKGQLKGNMYQIDAVSS